MPHVDYPPQERRQVIYSAELSSCVQYAILCYVQQGVLLPYSQRCDFIFYWQHLRYSLKQVNIYYHATLNILNYQIYCTQAAYHGEQIKETCCLYDSSLSRFCLSVLTSDRLSRKHLLIIILAYVSIALSQENCPLRTIKHTIKYMVSICVCTSMPLVIKCNLSIKLS